MKRPVFGEPSRNHGSRIYVQREKKYCVGFFCASCVTRATTSSSIRLYVYNIICNSPRGFLQPPITPLTQAVSLRTPPNLAFLFFSFYYYLSDVAASAFMPLHALGVTSCPTNLHPLYQQQPSAAAQQTSALKLDSISFLFFFPDRHATIERRRTITRICETDKLKNKKLYQSRSMSDTRASHIMMDGHCASRCKSHLYTHNDVHNIINMQLLYILQQQQQCS